MPTLQFKGKNIIWNHHLSVPYHTLEEVEDLHFQPEKGNGNLIIEGDNLIALKALLPEYAGKIKCIYIDPPYNTGNEGWVYNDKVNSPLINNWLGKTVGTDDLTRHDKWLCMTTPRLKMLRDLLSDDGAIFISIDDNEVANLRILMNEIYGVDNFVTEIVWRKTDNQANLGKIARVKEYIICFAKNKNSLFLNKIPLTDKAKKEYSYKDEKGQFRRAILLDKTRGKHYYEVTTKNGKSLNGPWMIKEEEFKKLSIENKILWTSSGDEQPYGKIYLHESKGQIANDFWDTSYGSNQEASLNLEKLFEKRIFDFPKSTKLISTIIAISTNENSIILDSFAGSGTTMHAVNELNREDGGNRKCILVQMKEESEAQPDKNICQNITRERNKLAIEKLGYESGFKYLKVGTAIDPEKMLEGQLPTYNQFAKYIYYLGTGEHLAEAKNINAENHYVGTHGAKAFYLIYEQDVDTLTRLALNLSIAEDIVKHSPNKRRVIYAPACFLDSDYMEEKQIEFVSIPYNLFERQTN